jgi:hypothetical protein
MGYHDPKWMTKYLASIELAGTAGQDIVCSVFIVKDCTETTGCVTYSRLSVMITQGLLKNGRINI